MNKPIPVSVCGWSSNKAEVGLVAYSLLATCPQVIVRNVDDDSAARYDLLGLKMVAYEEGKQVQ